jgi:hypothetical protein
MGQQINLFNPAFVRQRKHFSLLAMLQGWALILLGSLVFYGYAIRQVEALGKQSEAGARLYERGQNRLVKIAAEFSPQEADQTLRDEVRRMEKQLADQAALIELMKSGAVGNITGYSDYMRAFARQVRPGLWLTGFRVSGDAAEISLSGAVLEPEMLPAYIQRLNRESVMRGRTFATLQMRQAGGGASGAEGALPRHVEFTLHSSIDGGGRK